MSLTLLHGPAGSGKTNSLLEDIIKNKWVDAPDSFFCLLPFSSTIEVHQKKILAASRKKGVLLGQSLLTFGQFLTHLLKASLPRVHAAPMSLVRNVVRRLLFENNYPTFREGRNYAGIVAQAAVTLVRLKKAGLTPAATRSLFTRFITEELNDLCRLFEDVNTLMEKIGFFDEGDLTVKTLELIREKKLQWPASCENVFIDRIFPLTLGQREIIKALSEHFPHVNITVSYSFDYATGEDPFFYPSYSFLGEMASHSEYFPKAGGEAAKKLLSFTDPASELEGVAAQIVHEVKEGIPPDEITVILPPLPYYHRKLSQLLEAAGLAHSPSYTPPLFRLPEPNGDLDALTGLFREEKKSLRHLLASVSVRRDFEAQFDFEAALVFPAATDAKWMNQWREQEEQMVRLPSPSGQGGVRLIGLKEAAAIDTTVLFVTGFTHALTSASDNDPPFYTTDMLTDPYLKEILEGPTYRQGLVKTLLDQACLRTGKKVFVTYPKILWDGREQSYAPFLGDQESEKVMGGAPEGGPPPRAEVLSTAGDEGATGPVTFDRGSIFPRWRQTVFSISELNTFQQCPYKYYASHHLKLGRRISDEPEAAPDVRGQFIHRVLEALFREEGLLYRDAVEYDLYLNKLIEAGQKRAIELKTRDENIKKIPEALQEVFLKRVSTALASLLRKEIGLVREKKKKTAPRTFEWSFGKGTQPPLKIKTAEGDLFVSGRIDRIDVNEGEKIFSVIDYKTGNLDSAADILGGRSLQIPFYLMAVSTLLLPSFRPSSGLLVGLKDLNKWSGLTFAGAGEEEILGKTHRIEPDRWKGLRKEIGETAFAMIREIRQGHFAPAPRDRNLCRTCDYREICHYEENEQSLRA